MIYQSANNWHFKKNPQVLCLSHTNAKSCDWSFRGTCGLMAIVVENGHDHTSSNPRWDWLHFTYHKYFWERYKSNYSPSSYA